MTTRKTYFDPRKLALLAVVAVFVGMIVGLPIGHHHICDGLNESEHCAVHLLQTGLLLLGGTLLLVALTASEHVPANTRVVTTPLFSPRFTCPTRGPPRR